MSLIRLDKTLRAWDSSAFESVLKRELMQHVSELPLQQGLSHSSYVAESPITVMIYSIDELGGVLRVKVAIMYQGVLGGCGCADDPTTISENNEYCEMQIGIDKITAATTVRLV